MSRIVVIFALMLGVLIAVQLVIFLYFFLIWVRARLAGQPLTVTRIIIMRMRGLPPGLIVDGLIRAHEGGLDITLDQLEKHYLTGGNPHRVVDAMVRARNRDIDVPFDIVARADLSGPESDRMDPDRLREAAQGEKPTS